MKLQATLLQKFFTLGWIAIFTIGIGFSAANCVTFDQFESAIESGYGLSLADCRTATNQEGDKEECGPEACSFCQITQGFAFDAAPELNFIAPAVYEAPTLTVLPNQTVLVALNSGRAPPLA